MLTSHRTLSALPILISSLLLTIFAAAQTPSPPLSPAKNAPPTSKIIDAAKLLLDDKTLSADNMEGRAPGTRGGLKARAYVAKRFADAKLLSFGASPWQSFEITPRRSTEKVKAANVMGYLKGTKNPHKYLVISAHYDHLGIQDGQIYNGADDNASGTCALFAMAAYFAKHLPQNSLLFVAFDGEERGLLGSQYFVKHLPVPKASVLVDLNLDMVAHNDKNELYASGTYQNPALKPWIIAVQKKSPIKLLIGHDDPKTGSNDWTQQSDQGSFYDEKIPFIYFGVEDHKDYHKPSDDFSTINQKFYVGAVETVVAAAKLMDEKLK